MIRCPSALCHEAMIKIKFPEMGFSLQGEIPKGGFPIPSLTACH